jgi:hypothetical protein
MTRDEAIKILVRNDIAALSPEARASLLLDWWTIDASDPDYAGLPEELKAELTQAQGPGVSNSIQYEFLIHVALRHSFAGVSNDFLTGRLAQLGYQASVVGPIEVLARCPCCGYRSLTARAIYEICKVCFWEDDGSDDPDRMSGPNHMTLSEGRENYAMLGAVTEESRQHVLPDGKDRYLRE